ncbi:MAG: PAS domain-containing protein [Clostridiales bacterium]|nr:PAS domain-containing protein [Clostridiales bacterium]
MIKGNFKNIIEKIFCYLYSIIIFFIVSIQIIIEKKFSIDLFVLLFISLFLLVITVFSDILKARKLYDVNWYFAFMSASMWVILKILFFNYSIYSFLIGLLGFFMGSYRINKIKQQVIFSSLYSILILVLTLKSPLDLETQLLIGVMTVLIIGISMYSKYLILKWTNDHDNFDLHSLALANASEAFVVYDAILDNDGKPFNYRIVTANEAFEKLFGLTTSHIIGKTVLDILPKTETYWIETYGNVAMNMVNVRYMDYSKELNKHFQISTFPIFKGRLAVLFSDLTEQIATQQKLEESAEYVKRLNQSKSKFLKDVNHRIRTPLNGLLGALQLYKENCDEELLEHVCMEAKQINSVVDQVSKYVEFQDCKSVFELNNIVEIVEDVFENYPETLEYKFINKIDSSPMFLFDVNMCCLVLNKLIRNALKYSDNKPLIIRIEYYDMKQDSRKLHISVKDMGCGLSENQIEDVFNEYSHHNIKELYKDDNHMSLSLCKQLLNSAGGDLLVKSKIDEGSSFTIDLPHMKI